MAKKPVAPVEPPKPDGREAVRTRLQTSLAALSNSFQASVDEVESAIGEWMEVQGFNNEPGTDIALMHSELSEALEALRHERWEGPDGVTEELADTIIRILHFASKHGLAVSEAVISKMQKNLLRPFKHGKEF